MAWYDFVREDVITQRDAVILRECIAMNDDLRAWLADINTYIKANKAQSHAINTRHGAMMTCGIEPWANIEAQEREEVWDSIEAEMSESHARHMVQAYNIKREAQKSWMAKLVSIESIETRLRARDAKHMARPAQLRDIGVTTTPEDSNTGEEFNRPSDDEGGIFCISTAPQDPMGPVVAALTQNTHHHSTISNPDDMEHNRGPSGLP